MIFLCRQMQALFASTTVTSFKVKRGTSDLLGLSNKDLLVIPLSIKSRSLQARDSLWCDILRSEWIPSRNLANSLAFELSFGASSLHTQMFLITARTAGVPHWTLFYCRWHHEWTVCERHERKEEICNGQKLLPQKTPYYAVINSAFIFFDVFYFILFLLA